MAAYLPLQLIGGSTVRWRVYWVDRRNFDTEELDDCFMDTFNELREGLTKHENISRSITLPNYLLISCIVFKWQPLEGFEWRVNVIDRKKG